MKAHLRGCCSRWGFLCLWVSGCEDLGCPPCGGHDVLRGVVVAQPVIVVVIQPLPGVPVIVVVTQPLPWVPLVRRRHHRRPPGRLVLPDPRDPMVSTVRSVVGAQGGRPLLLHPGLPGRPVLCGVGGCTG